MVHFVESGMEHGSFVLYSFNQETISHLLYYLFNQETSRLVSYPPRRPVFYLFVSSHLPSSEDVFFTLEVLQHPIH